MANTYILQDGYKSYNWDHIKNDLIKTEVKTENVKLKKVLRPRSILGGKKKYRRLSIAFLSQNKKIK